MREGQELQNHIKSAGNKRTQLSTTQQTQTTKVSSIFHAFLLRQSVRIWHERNSTADGALESMDTFSLWPRILQRRQMTWCVRRRSQSRMVWPGRWQLKHNESGHDRDMWPRTPQRMHAT